MSKAFTKDDAPEERLVIPTRVPLPEGSANYVTDRGLALLRLELSGLESERARLEEARGGEDEERRHRVAVLAARIADVSERIHGAVLVDRHGQPHDEVRFGASVTLRPTGDTNLADHRYYQIVGVDEADVANGKVAFVAPLARAILGKRVGDTTLVRTARGDEELEIVAIEYEPH